MEADDNCLFFIGKDNRKREKKKEKNTNYSVLIPGLTGEALQAVQRAKHLPFM